MRNIYKAKLIEMLDKLSERALKCLYQLAEYLLYSQRMKREV